MLGDKHCGLYFKRHTFLVVYVKDCTLGFKCKGFVCRGLSGLFV